MPIQPQLSRPLLPYCANPSLPLEDLIERFASQPPYSHQILHRRSFRQKAAKSLPLPSGLISPVLRDALLHLLDIDCVTSLFSHQALSLKAIMEDGKHVCVATPTGSGKSLIYHIPVVNRLLNSENVTALFIYPTVCFSFIRVTNSRIESLGSGPMHQIAQTAYGLWIGERECTPVLSCSDYLGGNVRWRYRKRHAGNEATTSSNPHHKP